MFKVIMYAIWLIKKRRVAATRRGELNNCSKVPVETDQRTTVISIGVIADLWVDHTNTENLVTACLEWMDSHDGRPYKDTFPQFNIESTAVVNFTVNRWVSTNNFQIECCKTHRNSCISISNTMISYKAIISKDLYLIEPEIYAQITIRKSDWLWLKML